MVRTSLFDLPLKVNDKVLASTTKRRRARSVGYKREDQQIQFVSLTLPKKARSKEKTRIALARRLSFFDIALLSSFSPPFFPTSTTSVSSISFLNSFAFSFPFPPPTTNLIFFSDGPPADEVSSSKGSESRGCVSTYEPGPARFLVDFLVLLLVRSAGPVERGEVSDSGERQSWLVMVAVAGGSTREEEPTVVGDLKLMFGLSENVSPSQVGFLSAPMNDKAGSKS